MLWDFSYTCSLHFKETFHHYIAQQSNYVSSNVPVDSLFNQVSL